MARIAVIGAGTAGLVCAWAASARHDVTVFEAEPVAGGHARTLGGNVAAALPPGVHLDAGVVLYERRNFPTVHRLFDQLGVAVRPVPGATGLYLDERRRWLSPFGVRDSGHSLWVPPTRALHLLGMRRQRRAFLRRTAGRTREELRDRPIADYLDDGDFSIWLRLLLTYAWSTPFERTPALPAAMAVPMLTAFFEAEQWTSVVGGTWAFVRALLDRLPGRVRTGVAAARIERSPDGVRVRLADGDAPRFDQVVLATGPDQVLSLLADPTEAERAWFGPWAAERVTTVVHRSDRPWDRRGLTYRSEFDLFRTRSGGHGYSACLNRLAGLGDGPPWYGLAFGMGDEIPPEDVVRAVTHRVPRYTVAAAATVDAIRAANGTRRTWHAGAWLGDGLQEGAVRSALEVAAGLGAAVSPAPAPR